MRRHFLHQVDALRVEQAVLLKADSVILSFELDVLAVLYATISKAATLRELKLHVAVRAAAF